MVMMGGLVQGNWEHEAMMIYAALVAGKSASFADSCTRRLLDQCLEGESPFEMVKRLQYYGEIEATLRAARTGSYGRLAKTLPGLTSLDTETCTVEQLEQVHGIGPKTARFYLLWTRPGVRCAALDTHILKFLRSLGHDAPKSTPTAGSRYRALERAFLAEADRQGKTPRELDSEVWDAYSKGQTMAQMVMAL